MSVTGVPVNAISVIIISKMIYFAARRFQMAGFRLP